MNPDKTAVWKTLHKPNHADYADKASSNGKAYCYQVDEQWLVAGETSMTANAYKRVSIL